MYPNTKQVRNRQLITCEHGLQGTCWWCESKKVKPVEQKIDMLQERFDALLDIVKMLITHRTKNMTGSNAGLTTTTIIQNSLIRSGSDADKPASGDGLAFYYATDVDKIYQRRDSSWIDISFSRPTDSDARIINIETDTATGTLEVTDTN